MTQQSPLHAGNVALVTGAASGIGKAACLRLAGAGMKVCAVDLPGDQLQAAAAEIVKAAPGGDDAVLALGVDLADAAQIAAIHGQAISRFGKIHILMNNAVSRGGHGHDADIAEWRAAFEVNFWALVETVRAFLPGMLAMGEAGAVVNVGSKQGITNPPGHPIYNIAKSAVKTYTEGLEHELRSNRDDTDTGGVRAHLLIPGWTTTGNRQHQTGAWLPDQVIDMLLASIDNGDFYILCPDDEVSTEMDHKRILWGARDITENRPPMSRWHPDYVEAAKKACS